MTDLKFALLFFRCGNLDFGNNDNNLLIDNWTIFDLNFNKQIKHMAAAIYCRIGYQK